MITLPLLHAGVGGPDWLDWSVHWDTIALCLALSYGYYYAATRLRPRVSDAARIKRSQVVLFSLGVLALYVGGGTAIHDLGEEYLFTAHIMQHLLYTLVAPPLLIAGTPAWLWKWLLSPRPIMAVARVLTKPVIAFAFFNTILLFTHLPPILDLTLRVGAVHFTFHVLFVVSAMIMWWPILSPLRELPRLAPPLQMAYLFMQSLLPAIIASFVTFADTAVYSFYEEAPEIWGISPVADQQIAGGLMKLVGSFILWSFMTVVFFKWYARETAAEKEPRWEDVESELQELGLGPQGTSDLPTAR